MKNRRMAVSMEHLQSTGEAPADFPELTGYLTHWGFAAVRYRPANDPKRPNSWTKFHELTERGHEFLKCCRGEPSKSSFIVQITGTGYTTSEHLGD